VDCDPIAVEDPGQLRAAATVHAVSHLWKRVPQERFSAERDVVGPEVLLIEKTAARASPVEEPEERERFSDQIFRVDIRLASNHLYLGIGERADEVTSQLVVDDIAIKEDDQVALCHACAEISTRSSAARMPG
jgi:hypothetical protein